MQRKTHQHFPADFKRSAQVLLMCHARIRAAGAATIPNESFNHLSLLAGHEEDDFGVEAEMVFHQANAAARRQGHSSVKPSSR